MQCHVQLKGFESGIQFGSEEDQQSATNNLLSEPQKISDHCLKNGIASL